MRTMGRLRDVKDFERIVLSYKDGSVVTRRRRGPRHRLERGGPQPDAAVGTAMGKDAPGENAISLSIRKQSGTNTVAVVDRVLARLERIKATLPSDISVKTTRDQSMFIRKSFEEIQHHLLLGGLLAALVVFFFIRNLRVTIIAGLAIPTSIIGTFTVMKALGFTLNNMTMLSLSLATGIVIDDAIVVLENIFRYIEEKGVSPKEAAMKATGEIGLAVMATTLSLVVIFLPVAFMTGQVGRYFYSFGISSATAIMLSMFVSFTLTPALCAYWLRSADAKQGHQTQTKQRGVYAWMDRKYGVMLEWSMAHRGLMLAIAGVAVASAALLYPLRRQGTGARRRPERVQREPAAAAGHELRADAGVRDADRGRAAGGARRQPRGDDGVDPERQRQLLDPADADRRTRAVAAAVDAGRAPGAEQVPERADQRVGRHRHLGRVERRRRPRRRWRRHEPADDDHAGARHRGTAEARLRRRRPEGDDPDARRDVAARTRSARSTA